MINNDSIIAMIKRRRKELKITQAQLAEKMGISLSTIGRYETGVTPFTFDAIEAFSKALDVDLLATEILFDISEKEEAKKLIEQGARIKPVFIDQRAAFYHLFMERNGIKASYDNDNHYWTIEIDDGTLSDPISEKAMNSLFDRFSEHLKIEINALTQENTDGE